MVFDVFMCCLCLGLYTINRFWIKGLDMPQMISYITRSHFNDVMGGCACVCIVDMLFRRSQGVFQRIRGVIVPVLICFGAGIMWEYILPTVVHRGVSDPLDVLAYMIGGMIYGICQQLFTRNKK